MTCPAVSVRPSPRDAVSESRSLSTALASAVGVLALAVTATNASATITYDRAKAVNFAANYAFKVVPDGYFWIDSGTCKYYGAGVTAPSGTGLASGVGDDCAHFVSSCLGTPSGAGIPVDQPFANSASASYRAQYGNPSASGLASWLVSSGDATKVTSVSSLTAGDVIAYDWTGNGSIDHIVFYMGNNLISAHATSHLNVAYNWAQSSNPNEKLTFIHITLPNAATPEPTTLLAMTMPLAALRRRRTT